MFVASDHGGPLTRRRGDVPPPGPLSEPLGTAVDDGGQQPAGALQVLDRGADPPALVGEVGPDLRAGRREEAAVGGDARHLSLLIENVEKKFYLVAYGRARLIEEGHDALARPLLDKYQPERAADPRWTPDRVIVELRPDRMLTGR
jgi:hypothetical protein